ncbi:MAG: hypothetical protein EBY30_03860 [Rhodospirillales bacterium]|nr:hypothetical protein [Rhodospirillales bacterium]
MTKAASNKALAMLAQAGIAARVVEHHAVFTVAESAVLRGDLPGLHCKNLFLRAAKGHGFFLATLKEDRVVSVNALARAAGWPKVTMASAEELLAVLGVTPGSVTPLGLVNAAPGSRSGVTRCATPPPSRWTLWRCGAFWKRSATLWRWWRCDADFGRCRCLPGAGGDHPGGRPAGL